MLAVIFLSDVRSFKHSIDELNSNRNSFGILGQYRSELKFHLNAMSYDGDDK